jgi:hypothetical protein
MISTPGHRLIHLALAGFEKDHIRADSLQRYSFDRLPKDPKLRQRAVEFLRKQGKADLAREVETRGQEAWESGILAVSYSQDCITGPSF